MNRELSQLKFEYSILNKKLDDLNSVMDDLETRDDKTYRVILEADPIPGSVRQAGVGGSERYKELEGFKIQN